MFRSYRRAVLTSPREYEKWVLNNFYCRNCFWQCCGCLLFFETEDEPTAYRRCSDLSIDEICQRTYDTTRCYLSSVQGSFFDQRRLSTKDLDDIEIDPEPVCSVCYRKFPDKCFRFDFENMSEFISGEHQTPIRATTSGDLGSSETDSTPKTGDYSSEIDALHDLKLSISNSLKE